MTEREAGLGMKKAERIAMAAPAGWQTSWRALGLAVAVSRSEAELQLRADRSVPYGRVVQVLALAHQAGIVRVGFVTEPPSPARRP